MNKKTTKAATVKKQGKKAVNAIRKKGGMSKMAAPIGGAVIGAALGTAAGAVLSNESAKKTLKGVAETVGDYTADAINAVEKNQGDIKKIANDTIYKTQKGLKKS